MTPNFNWYKPECVYLTAGAANGGTNLNAFDNALRDAGITDFNLIEISSIVPAGTPVKHLDDGAMIPANGLFGPAIYEDIRSDEEGTEIASAVGVGIPERDDIPGMVFAYSCVDELEEADRVVRQMVDEGMQKRGCDRYSTKTAVDSTVAGTEHSAVISAALFCDDELRELVESTANDG